MTTHRRQITIQKAQSMALNCTFYNCVGMGKYPIERKRILELLRLANDALNNNRPLTQAEYEMFFALAKSIILAYKADYIVHIYEHSWTILRRIIARENARLNLKVRCPKCTTEFRVVDGIESFTDRTQCTTPDCRQRFMSKTRDNNEAVVAVLQQEVNPTWERSDER